ncbi:MAG: DUF4038 domain-containing protein [Candidatus Helarchaeota archaeon]|nr:DUF4038 domain-containing protein [Candidatus Helarchaeota archaeon]
MLKEIDAVQYQVSECEYVSEKQYADPFNEVDLDVIITDGRGGSWKVPAFWTGGNEWGVRFAPPKAGKYTFETVCSDKSNPNLHEQKGTLDATPYKGNNELLKHGPLRVAKSQRTFEFADGTPFFWEGDTWWYGLCKRISWPDGFKVLCENRISKGFNVVQIVAGLPCDAGEFDARAENEGGYVWEKGYTQINPEFFKWADYRIQHLVESGLLPCILGSWGFYLLMMGLEKMKAHWRYLIARWGAYPVVWCLAGEATMPYYEKFPNMKVNLAAIKDYFKQKKGWTQMARYVREINYNQRLVSIHPFPIPYWYRIFLGGYKSGRTQIKDPSLLDFEMLQTGHFERNLVTKYTANATRHAYSKKKPVMPVVNAEVVYEGHMQQHWQDMQRLIFWISVLNGVAGYTYGAGGIWQCNARDEPFGASPHVPPHTYENTPWEEAMHLPGSKQVGLGKSLLERFQWWLMEPHREWVSPHWKGSNPWLPHAAGIPGKLRIIYIPPRIYQWSGPKLKKLEPDITYHAFYFNPINGDEYDLGTITGNKKRQWQAPEVPLCQDWILILEKR